MSLMIVDLDGCISNDEWRWNAVDHSIVGRDARFMAYNSFAGFDRPANLHELALPNRVIFTARPERNRGITEAWLDRHKINIDFVMMRNDGDYRHSVEVKRDM